MYMYCFRYFTFIYNYICKRNCEFIMSFFI